MRAWLIAPLALTLLLTACPWAAKFRDQQVATSHQLAQGDRITPPLNPPARAEEFEDVLPVDKTWPVLEYTQNPGDIHLRLLSTATAEQTVTWVDSRLQTMGYASSDNLSRMLEGATYVGKGKYSQIYVKVDLNSSEQVTVDIKGTE
jgi:hypothetical protein